MSYQRDTLTCMLCKPDTLNRVSC